MTETTPNLIGKEILNVLNKETRKLVGKEGDAENWPRWNTIWGACRNGDVAFLERLVKADFSLVNLKNADGETSLHFACRHGHADCVEYLLKHDAKSYRNLQGKSPARCATENSNTGCLRQLCYASQVDVDECRELLFLSTERKDYASSAVLQRTLDPSLGEIITKDPAPETRRRKLEENIRVTEKLMERESVLIPPPELPDIPDTIDWTPTDLGRWIEFNFDKDSPTLLDLKRTFENCEITGKVLLNLEKSEILRLFQAIGILPKDRITITENFLTLQKKPVSLLFDQKRLFSVGIGEGLTSFRCVGFITSTLGTTLDKIRENVRLEFGSHNVRVPEPFAFVKMRGGTVPIEREDSTRIGEVGFIILITSAPLDEDEE